ncbi:MAG TPA: PP2C family protein-serine/threonine phosphatase [Vicinamibacterales bacterium]|nr:PP2C family protein-serine/threonine phosphatase [Vicinamibacterales bacterium]
MSLRTRLVLAFFLLSVVPLGAVTFYSYTNNVRALQDAAEREADLLAGELGQRMQLVTAQLGERVEHLMDIAELQAVADEASATAAQAQAAVATTAKADTPPATNVRIVTPAPGGTTTITQSALNDSIARSLGEAAMLLNNVELQNMRNYGRGGRPPGPPGAPPPPQQGVGGQGANANAGANASTQQSGRGFDPQRQRGSGRTGGSPDGRGGRDGRGPGPRPAPTPTATPAAPMTAAGATGAVTQVAPAPRTSPVPGTIPPPPPPGTPPPGAPPNPDTSSVRMFDANGKLMIDLAPIRREMLRAVVPNGRIEDLKPEDRQRIAAEINQRMVGIQQGIKITAAELEKRAQEAQREADAKSKVTASAKPAKAAPPAETKRRSSLTGSRIDVKVERDGEVVRQMNAELNLPNVLATVFSTTRGDRGEIPFAVGKDGTVYARTEADKARVAALGDVAKPSGPSMSRQADYIVVTTEDKSGSNLRLGIARPVSDSLATLRRTAARNAGLGLLFITIALVGIVPISTSLTRNLTVMSDAVSRIAKGDFRARVPVKANDEVGRLAVAFNKMAADVERHQQTAVEQERIRRELELGRQIQAEMLPHAPLHLGLTQVQGVSVPAREVGGDFFNYFVLDNGHVALLMGDVSGKGVGAALLMANIQASLRIRLGLGQDLSTLADALDRDIDANSPGPVYATIFIGILEPVTRRLRYVNAGHNPQYVLRKGGKLERMSATGLPVGLLSGRGYTEQQLQLAAGDQLFFYTDGCTEMEDERGDMLGIDRLEALLMAAAASDMPLKTIEDGISKFRGTSEQFDDATLMTVKVG